MHAMTRAEEKYAAHSVKHLVIFLLRLLMIVKLYEKKSNTIVRSLSNIAYNEFCDILHREKIFNWFDKMGTLNIF